jgi:hypothetical protein
MYKLVVRMRHTVGCKTQDDDAEENLHATQA